MRPSRLKDMRLLVPLLGTSVLCCLVLALLVGDIELTLSEILEVLTKQDIANSQNVMVIETIRLPRALLGLLVGMALAVAGVIAQSVLRNPLAEPGLIGINSGAALAAMILIVQVQIPPANLLPFLTFAGALVMCVAIYLLSWREGLSSMRLILVGIGLNALAGAGASFLSAFGDISAVQRAMVWLAGSLYDSSWIKIQILALWLIVPMGLGWLLSKELDLLSFGEDISRSLGQRINLLRSGLIFLCAAISGAAVASAGLIAFVGLVAPHIARTLIGHQHVKLLPVAALIGALLVMSADLLGRIAIEPLQLPVGLMTAILGAPFFLYLMWRQSRA